MQFFLENMLIQHIHVTQESKDSIGNENIAKTSNYSFVTKQNKITCNSLTYHGNCFDSQPCIASQLIFPIPTQTYYISLCVKASMVPARNISFFRKELEISMKVLHAILLNKWHCQTE